MGIDEPEPGSLALIGKSLWTRILDQPIFARQLRIHLKNELDKLFPNEIKRKEKRCLVHVANLCEDYILKKLPLLMPFLKKLRHYYRSRKMRQQTHCTMFGLATRLCMHMDQYFL